MAKRVANPEDVVAPVAPVSEKEPAAAVEAVESTQKVLFARNFGDRPNEQIIFADGTPYLFRGTGLLTDDPELIAKIREVSVKYQIGESVVE